MRTAMYWDEEANTVAVALRDVRSFSSTAPKVTRHAVWNMFGQFLSVGAGGVHIEVRDLLIPRTLIAEGLRADLYVGTVPDIGEIDADLNETDARGYMASVPTWSAPFTVVHICTMGPM